MYIAHKHCTLEMSKAGLTTSPWPDTFFFLTPYSPWITYDLHSQAARPHLSLCLLCRLSPTSLSSSISAFYTWLTLPPLPSLCCIWQEPHQLSLRPQEENEPVHTYTQIIIITTTSECLTHSKWVLINCVELIPSSSSSCSILYIPSEPGPATLVSKGYKGYKSYQISLSRPLPPNRGWWGGGRCSLSDSPQPQTSKATAVIGQSRNHPVLRSVDRNS